MGSVSISLRRIAIGLKLASPLCCWTERDYYFSYRYVRFSWNFCLFEIICGSLCSLWCIWIDPILILIYIIFISIRMIEFELILLRFFLFMMDVILFCFIFMFVIYKDTETPTITKGFWLGECNVIFNKINKKVYVWKA